MLQTVNGRCVCFLLLLAIGAGRVAADDAAKSPADIFKAKGLTKSGFLLVLPEEQTLHDAAAALRLMRGKLAVTAAKVKDAGAQIQTAEANLKASEDTLHEMDKKMANGQSDNAMIGRYNLLIDQVKEQTAKIKELTDARDKLMVSKSDYITAVLDASAKADSAAHAYDVPHADKELASAIETYNLTAKPKVKLGPSAYFTEDIAFVNQCLADINSGVIPITATDGVPEVEVLINGTFSTKMIWDSGCTGITLSAKSAHALGLKPSPDDQTGLATIADGSQVKVYEKMLDSIRIGAFTVHHVRCTISDGDAEGADLLGNEFQHLFQFKLDINNKTLQLSPLDSQMVTTQAGFKSTIPKPAAPVAAAAPVVPTAPVAPAAPVAAAPVAPTVPAAPSADAPAEAPKKPVAVAPRRGKAVSVKFAEGDTELATMKEGVKYFSDRDFPLQGVPDEMDGLTFTRRVGGSPCQVDIDMPAGSTLYVLIDSDKSKMRNPPKLNQALVDDGWTRLDDDVEWVLEGKHPYIAVYKITLNHGEHYRFKGGSWSGIVLASKNLEVVASDPAPDAGAAAAAPEKIPTSQLVGVWFEPASGSSTTLNADGTAKSKDDAKGTWIASNDGRVVEIKWTESGASDIYRLSKGKWTRYGYLDGKLQSTGEISPP